MAPPPSPSSSYIARLPADVRAMVAALPAEEQEVFSYLASYSAFDSSIGWKVCKKPKKHHQQQQQQNVPKSGDHQRAFGCDCLDCYLKYWQLWVSSPNTAVIDKALELLESTSSTSSSSSSRKSSWMPKKKRSNPKNSNTRCKESKDSDPIPAAAIPAPAAAPVAGPSSVEVDEVKGSGKKEGEAVVSKPRSKQVAPLDFKVDMFNVAESEGGEAVNEDGLRRSFGTRASEALGFVCEKLLWMWNPRLRRRQ